MLFLLLLHVKPTNDKTFKKVCGLKGNEIPICGECSHRQDNLFYSDAITLYTNAFIENIQKEHLYCQYLLIKISLIGNI